LGRQPPRKEKFPRMCPYFADTGNGHEIALELVSGAHFGRVLRHFLGPTRLKGSWGQVRQEIRQNPPIKSLIFTPPPLPGQVHTWAVLDVSKARDNRNNPTSAAGGSGQWPRKGRGSAPLSLRGCRAPGVFNIWFSDRPEIVDFGSGRPRAAGESSKKAGGEASHLF